MAIKILRRGTKRINIYLSCFYLSAGIGGIINIIYANLFQGVLVYILHFITYYILCFAMVFLLIFVLILLKPVNKFKFKTQMLILVIFGLLLLGLLTFPDGITINQSTNWKPSWSWSFFIYSTVICSAVVILPTSYYSLRIYMKFDNRFLKKKWKFFQIGMYAYFFLFYGTSLSNTLNTDLFRLIWSLVSLPTLLASYLLYYGVGKQLE
ncbi:hypothetical protein LCGC14_1674950 [marine sediment metagenome]|uniref:Histidine kinase N-terminal 7TM region domain-containing protein n=1 Tax=marine sediment metagenome TaxID=412755 RepID=A0A0F9HR40_9ZZZZ